MTRHGRLTSWRTGALAAGLLLLALLAWSMQRPGAASAAAPAICAPADCPAAGEPQRLTFPTPADAAWRTGATGAKPLRASVMHVKLVAPRGRRAVAVVTGPQGRRWRITRSRTFFPKRFGRWTVTGQRIVGRQTVAFPQHRTTLVAIRRGGRGRVQVRWSQVVSSRTRVARETAIRSVARRGAAYAVQVTDPAGRLAVGDTLAAGPSAQTPQGLLITVASVRRDGDTAIVTGAQAPLSAIGPQARITVRPQLELGAGPIGGAAQRAAAASTSDAAPAPGARAAAQPEGAVEKPYRCENGVAATLKGSMGLSTGAEIGISWGGFWHPLTIRAIAAASMRQSSNLTLRVSGKAKCELDVDLLSKPIRYSPITFSVGPVPVVITPKLNFHVIAEGEVEGAVETSVRQSLDARLGLEWDGKKLIPIKGLDNRFQFTPLEPQFNAGIMAGIGPKLMFDVYEVGGPYLTAEGLMRFSVDSVEDPWWQLRGGFQAGAGIAFQVWRFSFDRNVPDLFSKEWTIAKASGAAPPQLATTELPGAIAGTPYGAALTATAGSKPLTWAVTNGALPAGLALNPATGAITGTPTTPGRAGFTVTVSDAKKKTSSRNLGIVVAAPKPSIETAALPKARLAEPYVVALAGKGSTEPYSWSVASGALPTGLTLDARSGVLSGVPTTRGSSSFTLALQGGDGQRATRAFDLTVDAAPVAIPAQTLPGAVVEAPYRATLRAEGGVAPLTWTIAAGALPAGLALDAAAGTLSGTPTTPGAATFTVTATDVAGQTASRELTLTSAYPAFSIGEQTLLSPMAGQPYSAQLVATGGGAPVGWAVTAGALPAGLSLAADGKIDGTPTTEGPATLTVTATDKFGQRAQRELTLTVVPNAVEVVTTRLAGGRVGSAYSQVLEVRGGRAPYRWTRTGGTLPAGLTLADDGTVSGTPSTSGARTFDVQVTDADGVTARGGVSISIAGNTPQILRSVSCPTDDFCVATDYYGGAVQWDGDRWADREQVSSGRRESFVSCAAAGECVLVDTAGETRILSGGVWSDGPAVTGGVNPSYVKMVSCATTTFCQLAAQTRGSGRAAIWTFDGSAWSNPVEFSGTQMTSVQCLTTTNCVAAIGSNQSIVRWNGATWSTEQSLPISWTQQVACTPTGRCVAGGTFGDYSLWQGASWSAGRPTGGRPAYPVTCARTGSFCVFAGMEGSPNVYTWDGSAAPSAPFAAPDTVFAASCSSSRLCMFVSTNGTAHRWDGTSWRSEGVISAA